MLWTETKSLKTGSSTIALRAEIAGAWCGVAGTLGNEGVVEVVEGSTALETLLMHLTISSTSVSEKPSEYPFLRNKILKMFSDK